MESPRKLAFTNTQSFGTPLINVSYLAHTGSIGEAKDPLRRDIDAQVLEMRINALENALLMQWHMLRSAFPTSGLGSPSSHIQVPAYMDTLDSAYFYGYGPGFVSQYNKTGTHAEREELLLTLYPHNRATKRKPSPPIEPRSLFYEWRKYTPPPGNGARQWYRHEAPPEYIQCVQKFADMTAADRVYKSWSDVIRHLLAARAPDPDDTLSAVTVIIKDDQGLIALVPNPELYGYVAFRLTTTGAQETMVLSWSDHEKMWLCLSTNHVDPADIYDSAWTLALTMGLPPCVVTPFDVFQEEVKSCVEQFAEKYLVSPLLPCKAMGAYEQQYHYSTWGQISVRGCLSLIFRVEYTYDDPVAVRGINDFVFRFPDGDAAGSSEFSVMSNYVSSGNLLTYWREGAEIIPPRERQRIAKLLRDFVEADDIILSFHFNDPWKRRLPVE